MNANAPAAQNPSELRSGILNRAAQIIIGFAVEALILFLSAGTLAWV